MSALFGDDFITQKYLRLHPGSRRARSWAGVMVHIQTENGVWRTGGSGYTYAGTPDALVLPFEDAVKQINHCGPEKMGKFLRVEVSPFVGPETGKRLNLKNPARQTRERGSE
jgi:hypothetical protein